MVGWKDNRMAGSGCIKPNRNKCAPQGIYAASAYNWILWVENAGEHKTRGSKSERLDSDGMKNGFTLVLLKQFEDNFDKK